LKRIAALLGVLALTTAAWSQLAQADPAFKVTGGGQILTDGQTTGAGSTLAFTAQQEAAPAEGVLTPAKGQVQYVDRSGDTQIVRHGYVTCLEAVEGQGIEGAAYIGGYWTERGNPKAPESELDIFEIYVEDNGEPNQGSDLIFFNDDQTLDCNEDQEHDEQAEVALARGNVQVHN
jgi:hypothetical protein